MSSADSASTWTRPRSTPDRPPARATVAALLVSHDGARWLPAVLDGLAAQDHRPDRVVAVDTGSRDHSVDLLSSALGPGAVQTASGSTSYPAAVRQGVEQAGDCEWIWLLHDDSNPDPGALAALLAAAEDHPDADVLGPKLREWPSLRRLLELGVTISGTGRRETGLERGEYDQGQHDDVRRVLAVNTAGMLVRRSLLDRLGGFDDQLPVFGNDLDFGWRAAASGHTTLIVPQAVVFHAEAAHRGVRRTHLTGRHTHYAERRAALFVLLANCRRGTLPFLWLRLLLGTFARVTGLLVTRRVGPALDELAALVSLYTHPREILRGRRERQELHTGDPAVVRGLLAPWWVPYRHGLDLVSDLAAALTNQAQDVAERRRSARVAAEGGARAVRVEEDTLAEDSGIVVRFVTNPVALAVALFLVLAAVGARDVLGSVAGGALSPPPASVADWWRLHLEAWHPLGTGTTLPAPAYLLPFGLAGTLLLGSADAVVTALMYLAVPLALWGSWRFLRVVGHLLDPRGAPRWVLAWGAGTYALVPVVSGAWGAGHFGTVAVAALLPWLAHAALGFADPVADRRWRAAWRTGVLLALGAAFTPMAWFGLLLLGLVVLGAGAAVSRRTMTDRTVWGPPLLAVGLVPVLLAPWWIPLLLRGAGAGLVLEAGGLPMPRVDGVGLLLGRLVDAGAPWWLGLVLLVLALAALVPRSTRVPVLVCWLVALVATIGAATLGRVTVSLPATDTRASSSIFVLLVQGALVVAVVVAAQGVSGRVPRPGRPPSRFLVLPLALAAAVLPALGLGWFVATAGDRPEPDDAGIPAYMTQNALLADANGVLVLRGSVDDGLTWSVHRGDGVTLGEDEILALSPEDTALSEDLRMITSQPSPDLVADLAGRGIEYVLLPAPADGRVASVLDATGGLLQASAENRQTRAWQVETEPPADAVSGPGSWLRVALLLLQGGALLVALVLCGPTRREEVR
ncbi:glycosyltransferase family 2 protein [Nocardioides sp.]|uniref:glycosyltransferase family 2 protein n=1 Tax=Nocardioides sp. TaxID=35761 RepID=UPI0027329963|nr:glycosyltransferase family 2 protein [Nocardioides sp.]MDP3894748.1 glycosyltransferase family 2 protein [Nocardioides sp.]